MEKARNALRVLFTKMGVFRSMFFFFPCHSFWTAFYSGSLLFYEPYTLNYSLRIRYFVVNWFSSVAPPTYTSEPSIRFWMFVVVVALEFRICCLFIVVVSAIAWWHICTKCTRHTQKVDWIIVNRTKKKKKLRHFSLSPTSSRSSSFSFCWFVKGTIDFM